MFIGIKLRGGYRHAGGGSVPPPVKDYLQIETGEYLTDEAGNPIETGW